MNQLKLVLLVVLLPLVGFAQSKALSSTDTIQKNIQEKFQAFSEASTFFFETLDENFERDSNGENI